jgi:hypothetical protein
MNHEGSIHTLRHDQHQNHPHDASVVVVLVLVLVVVDDDVGHMDGYNLTSPLSSVFTKRYIDLSSQQCSKIQPHCATLHATHSKTARA